MSNDTSTHTTHKPSKLEKFSIGFEFNETWADARKKYIATKQ